MHGCLWKLCASTRSPLRGHSRPQVQRLTICTPSPHAEGLTGCQSPLAPSCLHLLSSSRSLWWPLAGVPDPVIFFFIRLILCTFQSNLPGTSTPSPPLSQNQGQNSNQPVGCPLPVFPIRK